ncbi:uncharacterized protein N7483_004180 [Penicillium malachiteum]|uniref:uncharacterized protein n=1 Tax=Penicillium malachiteum TaxID=1324776 RepID=UPI0025467A80|nr:uncharacterized protein N7483_004180 [Penicillium malachiteum]KAJ5729672.1 hypothetical protein N7483_004180 [Penicillium malachiteum]
MADFGTQRILRELLDFGDNDELAMKIHYEDNNIRNIKAILVGTPGTPYAYGFYQLEIEMPPQYPEVPPKVTLCTTNYGNTRFGPNLYASGKVCLSILGTWTAHPGEGWSAAQGLESTLISIQSLFSENPYFLEPGMGSRNPSELVIARKYAMKVAHENIRLTVLAPLHHAMHGNESNRLGPFAEFYKKRFLWYRENYIATIDKYRENAECQGIFPLALFECHGNNAMRGIWDWDRLKRNLGALEHDLITEINGWPTAGLDALANDLFVAHKLKDKFESLEKAMSERASGTCALELVDGNPFVWQITYFGQSESMLSDGVFNVKICISTDFPRVQPRVFVTTPIFHARVTGGHQVMAYLPVRSDDMAVHLEGILNVLEEASPPPYNPLMVVNTEAARLCWESSDNQREYRRRVRRSAQDSTEAL